MDDQKSYFGVFIPRKILEREDLNAVDKLVYGFILSFKNKVCYAGNDHFEKCLGISRRTAQRSLTKLHKNGYIFIKNAGLKNRRIYDTFNKPQKYELLSKLVTLVEENNWGK